MVPSGASTGAHEAVELRDGDRARYKGKGVLKAVESVNLVLGPAVEGFDATAQRELDAKLCELDGSGNKGVFGANAILGVSLANARAAATSVGLPLFRYLGGPSASTLPVPMMNVINGGKHAAGALQFQECMIVPVGANSVAEAVRYGAETFHALGKLLHDRHLPTLVGDEGGYAPPLDSLEGALDLLMEAIRAAGYSPGSDIALAIDAAATEFYRDGMYFPASADKAFSAAQMVDFYERIVTDYPVISIEDGFSEDDWDGWRAVTERLGDRVQLVGDDLFVTNTQRLGRGIRDGIKLRWARNCMSPAPAWAAAPSIAWARPAASAASSMSSKAEEPPPRPVLAAAPSVNSSRTQKVSKHVSKRSISSLVFASVTQSASRNNCRSPNPILATAR